jgi:hypothetical protein
MPDQHHWYPCCGGVHDVGCEVVHIGSEVVDEGAGSSRLTETAEISCANVESALVERHGYVVVPACMLGEAMYEHE